MRDATACAPAAAAAATSWADCVSGTLPPEEVTVRLRQAGFRDVTLVGLTGYKTAPSTIGALFRGFK